MMGNCHRRERIKAWTDPLSLSTGFLVAILAGGGIREAMLSCGVSNGVFRHEVVLPCVLYAYIDAVI